MHINIKLRAVILTALVILVAGICLLPILFNRTHHNTAYTAYIYENGILTHTIPLSELTQTQYLTCTDTDGNYNIIEASCGCIRISEANCPDQICVDQGYIFDSLIPITCLPNRLIIELKAGVSNASDAVTY